MSVANINLKVLIMDTDYYALQAVNGYLAWDRRTRVTFLAENPAQMWDYLDRTPLVELPDVILIDSDHIGGADRLAVSIRRLVAQVQGVVVLCLAQFDDLNLVEVAADAGARGYLLKAEVRSQIAWAIVYALEHPFIVTGGIAKIATRSFNSRVFHATTLPRQREFPELTDRIRQAIELCVVKGMPAHLAADEMGISLHTIRSYIKEGYRILEAYDETKYPEDMSPQERAFMRITRFSDDEAK